MNDKAVQLGLSHTHFANPHGLDAEGHYSSANDMARLTAYALHNPTFARIVKTELKKHRIPTILGTTHGTTKTKCCGCMRELTV